MNTQDLLTHLDAIKPMGKKAKVEKLTKLLQDPFASNVIRQALDPFRMYHIHKRFEVTPGREAWTHYTDNLLTQLASRELSGNAAHDALKAELSRLKPEGQELLWRVLTKDIRCGVGTKTVNEAVPGLVADFEAMKAQPYAEKRIKQWPVIVEPKYDGVRALLICHPDGSCSIVSRVGKPLPGADHMAQRVEQSLLSFPALRNLVINREGIVIDGELDCAGGFNTTVGDVRRHDKEPEGLVFRAFDLIPLKHFEAGHFPVSLTERRRILPQFITALREPSIVRVQARFAYKHDDVMAMYDAIRQEGGEGVIVKPQEHPYECKRSYGWLKIKDQQTVDVPITDVVEGTGKYQHMMGAVWVDFNGHDVKVGTGWSDEQRRQIGFDPELYKGRMIEVEFHETTPDGSLRHPRFVRWRDDKLEEEGHGS